MQTWKRDALWGLAMIALLAVAAGGKNLLGQSSGDASRPALPAVNDPWPEVNLNAVVLDKHGAPQKVDEREFQFFEDGAERPLHLSGSPDSPVSLGFIIDSSHSMENRRGSVITAVNEIVKSLPDGSEAMAVLFAEEAYIDLPFTPVSTADLSFLDRMDARGGTALYDAIAATNTDFVAHARFARRALVLISDGYDNASQSQLEDILRSQQCPGAPTFYSLFVRTEDESNVEARFGRTAMEILAKAGGGVALTPKEKDFAPAIARLADMIRSQYVLHFTAADPARDGKAHKLEVRLPVKDLRILALPAYYAPSK